MMNIKDRIKSLIDKQHEIVASERNQSRSYKYNELTRTARDQWRPNPKPVKEIGLANVPIVVDVQNNYLSSILEVNLIEYYQNPQCFLENHLRMNQLRFELVNDDRFFNNEVPIWLATPFETSMFGQGINYQAGEDPNINQNPVIHELEDLDRLEMPDFFKSGMMPLAHELYNRCQEMASGELQVIFPDWTRGPFSTAVFLRDYSEFLVDLLLNPEFVHKFMQFIVNAHIHWYREKEKYLRIKPTKANLFNDEISQPSLSPKLYKEFVFPYEEQIAKFHGGIEYWHSCSDLTNFISEIKQLPDIEMFHCGPWTNVDTSSRNFAEKKIEFCINSIKDLFEADETQMKSKIESIVEAVKTHDVKAFYIRASGIMKYKNYKDDFAKINHWVDICREVLANHQ